MSLAMSLATSASADEPVKVGSKKFTESVILGEIAVRLLVSAGIRGEHRAELGGTQVLWSALTAGEIGVYAEYTGTIREEILGGKAAPGDDALRAELAQRGIVMSAPLGFDDSYALGMREKAAAELGVTTISDLSTHAELRFGFGNEFMDRKDGFRGLAARYGLPQRDVRGLDHDLAYRGLESGDIDVIDLYSTDAEIRFYGLRVLQDDRHFFPEYAAVLLFRADLGDASRAALTRLEGRVDTAAMIAMNARAKLDRVPEGLVAEHFLRDALSMRSGAAIESPAASLVRTTGEHLFLVGLSVLLAIIIAIPLGIVAAKKPRVGQVILALTGVLQTIPTLALLVVLIPLLGLGTEPAIVALVLYGLLPIVRNTHAGLTGIPASLRESAEALGLPPAARLRLVELPLASRAILAGIKTSAVIAVGSATLGALIGAGGYGQPILTGIRLNRYDLILQGAIPAAILALLVQGAFDLAELWFLPKGLRL